MIGESGCEWGRRRGEEEGGWRRGGGVFGNCKRLRKIEKSRLELKGKEWKGMKWRIDD